jgi:hypothetical protein
MSKLLPQLLPAAVKCTDEGSPVIREAALGFLVQTALKVIGSSVDTQAADEAAGLLLSCPPAGTAHLCSACCHSQTRPQPKHAEQDGQKHGLSLTSCANTDISHLICA